MSFIPKKEHQDVNDLHTQFWWKAVGEAPHMHIHREQGPHTPAGAAKGRIHLSDIPASRYYSDIPYIMHMMQQNKKKRKDATYNFQKGHLRTAWSTSQTPFWNIHFWIHQHLTEPSEPGELCAEHMRCHQAVQWQQSLQTFTAHPVHFSKTDWLLHVSQRVKQIKAQQFHSANYIVFY